MRTAAALAALALVGGCATVLLAPTELDARRAAERWPGTTVEDLQRGQGLYTSRCGTCHGLYLPTALPAAGWPHLLDEMGPKALLVEAERQAIERYLITTAQPADVVEKLPPANPPRAP